MNTKQKKNGMFVLVIVIMFFIFFLVYAIAESFFSFYTKKIYLAFLLCLILAITISSMKLFKEYDKTGKQLLERIYRLLSVIDGIKMAISQFYNSTLSFLHLFFKENKMNIDYENKMFDAEEIIEAKNKSCEELIQNFDSNVLIQNINCEIAELDNLINIISREEDRIFEDIEAGLDTKIQKQGFQKMVVEYKYYSEIIFDFMQSIIHNLGRSSEPLSESIYTIKTDVTSFVDNVLSWKNKLNDESSDQNFNNIIANYNTQNEEFSEIFVKINRINDSLEKELLKIGTIVDNVFERAGSIQDIAEKIKILSINASIESARAGEYGKGFKVVAFEIEKLSKNTQDYVKEIVPMVEDAKKIIESITSDFKASNTDIIDKLNNQKDEFRSFYDMLIAYYENLNALFSLATTVNEQVNANIDSLTPIFQLTNISMQEMDNLNHMIQIYLEDNKEEMDQVIDTIDDDTRKQILHNLVNTLENQITSEGEIEVLNHISEKYQLQLEKTIQEDDIELF